MDNTIKEKIKYKLGSKLYYMPRKRAHTILFENIHGYKMDWSNPQTIDEKMRWLLVYSYGRREAFFADKYMVRKYIKECGWGELLTDLYGCWKSTREICLNNLPDAFVLKTNHASGGVLICTDKKKVDWKLELQRIEKRLHINYANRYCEYHYKYIKRRVIAEELLDDGREERMTDYKVHCFNGEPYCIEVVFNRKDSAKSNYYDLKWNKLDYVTKEHISDKIHDKPRSLETMLQAAKDISAPFPFARVDFYDVKGKPFFGEITLCPSGGNNHEFNETGQREMGKRLRLPTKKEIFLKNIRGYRI